MRLVPLIALLAFTAALATACGGSSSNDAVAAPPPMTAAPTATEAPVTAEAPVATEPVQPKLPKRLGSGEPVTFAFGGDVMFEEPIRSYLSTPTAVFAPIAKVLRRADVAMVNLETVITERGTPTPAKAYLFRAPPSAFDAIRRGGIDVVTVANNHGMDYGAQGLEDTLRAAERKGVPVVGGGRSEAEAFRPWRTTVRGQRIAVIGATQVIDEEYLSWWEARGRQTGVASAKYDMEDRLVRQVIKARRASDTVVVYLHWGQELEPCPLDRQVSLAERLVKAGADIIVGSHAHLLLGGGMLDRAFVDYGLGNFVFYTGGGIAARTGVVEVTATGRRIDGYRFVPATISGGRPVPVTGEERAGRIAEWNALRGCTGLDR
jgi:poly-gamma-glutamate capsule biosynthesis protein CapA/YwtB (metallophosphatase superfamily)